MRFSDSGIPKHRKEKQIFLTGGGGPEEAWNPPPAREQGTLRDPKQRTKEDFTFWLTLFNG